MVTHDLQDYARWDDAVKHLVTRFDPAWADDNISAYLGVVQGYDHLLVLDERGRAIYAFEGRHRAPPPVDAAALLGPDFARGLGRIGAIGPTGKPGYQRFHAGRRQDLRLFRGLDHPPYRQDKAAARATRTLVLANRIIGRFWTISPAIIIPHACV